MKRRIAIAGLAMAVAATTTMPAHSEPAHKPYGKSTGRFQRLDALKLGKIVNAPQVLAKDKVVDALVELSGDPVAVQQASNTRSFRRDVALRKVKARQDAAVPRLNAAGATTYEHLTTVLNAIHVRVKVSDLSKVAAVRGVKTVQVSRLVKPQNAASARFTGVGKTWQTFKHTGKGRVIAVIDTGIDYTHADFGGPGTVEAFNDNDGTVIEPGSFPTAKVTAGYDFVGDDYDPGSDIPANIVPKPDPDPLDCNGHGSHVSGTAAGAGVSADGTTYQGPYNNATLNKTFDVEPGAAPEATLKGYRVFSCDGSTPTSIVIAAIDRAVSDGVNVINMSLGSPFGTAHDLESTAVKVATDAGVLVVTSMGNEGEGAYVAGSPGTLNESLAVAAVDSELAGFPAVTITGAVTSTGLVANDADVASPITGQLADVGLGCEAADYTGTSGKIVLSTRGVCARTDRAEFGQQAGALAVIMINDTAGLPPFEGEISEVTIPFIGVDGDDSAAFLAADGQSVTLTQTADIPNPTYKHVADFSSNGPRRGDSAQKPDIAAPGVSIPSVDVGTGTGSVRISGTSMAAPHAAGVAALVWQAHSTWSPMQVKSVIMSTASPGKIKGYDSRRLGTGLVQPLRASEAKTYAWTPSNLNSLRFGMNELPGAHTETQKFRISNKTRKTVTYDLSTELSSKRYGADVKISPKSVRIASGDTKTVSVRIHLSRSDVAKLPGASANDGGKLTSIHGLIVGRPRADRKGVLPLRISLMFVPVPLSNIEASASVAETGPGVYSPITLHNTGVRTGDADVYAWLLTDPAGDAPDPDVPDLTNIGVQSFPGQSAGLAPSDRLVVFAASQALGTSTQAAHEVDIAFDTDGDGNPNFVTFAVDTGLVTAGAADGTVTAFTVNAETGDLVDAWSAPAPANGSTVELPVAASSLGLTDATGPIDMQAVGFTLVDDVTPEGDGTGLATFDPYALPVSQGGFVTLKPGQRKTVPVEADASRFATQSHLGWLVITFDDRAGLREAGRVKLEVVADVLAIQKAKRTNR